MCAHVFIAMIEKERNLMVYNKVDLCLITAMCCFTYSSIRQNTIVVEGIAFSSVMQVLKFFESSKGYPFLK